mmetsp:Transcript_27550/g.64661  ORF Transcript_27550/g.64661 Transcript_27550/m.64661 type:complete len:305 (+) Transcript_27550:1220-2134(+)
MGAVAGHRDRHPPRRGEAGGGRRRRRSGGDGPRRLRFRARGRGGGPPGIDLDERGRRRLDRPVPGPPSESRCGLPAFRGDPDRRPGGGGGDRGGREVPHGILPGDPPPPSSSSSYGERHRRRKRRHRPRQVPDRGPQDLHGLVRERRLSPAAVRNAQGVGGDRVVPGRSGRRVEEEQPRRERRWLRRGAAPDPPRLGAIPRVQAAAARCGGTMTGATVTIPNAISVVFRPRSTGSDPMESCRPAARSRPSSPAPFSSVHSIDPQTGASFLTSNRFYFLENHSGTARSQALRVSPNPPPPIQGEN